MKIAVTFEDGQVFQHFGHCENFKIYQVENKQIIASEVVSAIGSGHGALAAFLQSHDVDTLICGGIGGGARTALAEAGITLYPGVTGDADASVLALQNDSLAFNPDTMCSHHEGNHVCGEDKHGCAAN
ncbi:MAG: NifB/NifX family molybdenum-iron cluster-binding protein [Lachnospiraceae bacterium]